MTFDMYSLTQLQNLNFELELQTSKTQIFSAEEVGVPSTSLLSGFL
jgi:hypothetical protein